MNKRTVERILSFASSPHLDAAEVFFRSYTATTIEVKEQKVDAFDQARDLGAGLRVLANGRMGFAFTTDLSDAVLVNLAESALANARNTEPDPYHSIPDRPSPYASVSIYDPELVALTGQEKIGRVMGLERAAFGVDKRIKRIRKASATFSSSETFIMNSRGAFVTYQGTAVSSSIEVVAEEQGESQAGSDFDMNRFYRKLDIEKVGVRAAQRALDLLGAKTISSARLPVMLDPLVAGEFLAMMASGFSAENVQKRKSLFIGRLGSAVAAPAITVLDDGVLPGGIGSAPSDDEAVAMKKKKVIDKGLLSLFLYNTYTANKDKTESTGNGMRGGFKGMPAVGITNLYLEPGAASPEELIGSLSDGLYVTEVMGMHMANAISGDFSVGATGFRIENGKKSHPVREITIAGNILDLMKNVAAVGNDLRFAGRIGCPSLLIKELSVGGK